MIKVVAKNVVAAERIAEFKAAVVELVAETRKESGCISYQLFQDVKDPRVLSFIEEWQDREALAKHMQSLHFLKVVPQLDRMKVPDAASEVNVYDLVI